MTGKPAEEMMMMMMIIIIIIITGELSQHLVKINIFGG